MKHQTHQTQKKAKEKPIPQERNPLQHFNSLSTKACEPPKSSLQSSFHSNYSSSSSSSFSSTSSSKPLLSRNPKSLFKCTRNTISTLKATNLGSRKNPSIVKNAAFPKPKMKQPRLNRPNCEIPKLKKAQRSNLLSDLASGSEKSEVKLSCLKKKEVSGCEKSEVFKLRCIKQKEVSGDLIDLDEIDNNLNVVSENGTPVNKLFCGSSLDSAIYEDSNANSSSNSKVKTPPIEPSVSPEIQFGGSSLLVSEATPGVCYGTGHVLSGVTDKRKCRSRGILTVGDCLDYSLGSGKNGNESGFGYSFDGKEDVKVKKFGSLIPVPTEASVKWLLSPCDENGGSPKGESSSKLMNLGDVEGSSPSGFIGSDSDLVCDSSERVCRILYTPTYSSKTCMSSPRRFEGFKGFAENLSERRDGDFLSNGVVEQDKNGFRNNTFKENSPLSIGSLSSGNVMQTPNSDYTSGGNKGGCWLRMNKQGTCTFKPELELDAQILGRASSILDPLGLSYQSTDLSSSSCSVDLPLRKNFDTHVSSISVSSVDNMSQSHMRISWRDALASRSSDMDELDCCRCLSDEDTCVDELQKLGNDCTTRRENGKSTGSACKTPECIEHEIEFPSRKKEKVSPYKPKSCAESISTDGGGFAESEDFD